MNIINIFKIMYLIFKSKNFVFLSNDLALFETDTKEESIFLLKKALREIDSQEDY